jgi:chromosome segregation ATPase
LAAVVAQLQEGVALAESQRHDAELAAQQAQQTAADLRQQLAKVRRQVAAREALLVELEGRLQASALEVGGLTARHAAAQAEKHRLDGRRHQLLEADAVLQRLMDAVGTWSGKRSPVKTSGGPKHGSS